MRNLFSLEVTGDASGNLLPGDEVIIDANAMPEGNGQDIGAFRMNGEYFISRFTRFGNQIIMLPDDGPIQVVRSVNVDVIGKVVGGSMEMDIKKAPAGTGAVSYA